MFTPMLSRLPVTRRLLLGSQQRFGSSGHHDHHLEHGTGWPKPSGRGQFSPAQREDVVRSLATASHSVPGEVKEEVLSLEGWLFGKKVIYLNTKDPWYNQIPHDQQYLFGERPLPLGHKRKLSDWEILTYCSWIAFFVMVAIAWWAKPETDLYVWAREELREREILAHRELKKLQA